MDPVALLRRAAHSAMVASAVMGAVPSIGIVHAQPAPATKPGPSFEEVRAIYEALTEAERRSVQDALVWTGDYNGSVDGTFGRQTYEAVLAYQRSRPGAAVGFQDAKVRAALIAEAKKIRDGAGFQAIDDKESGIRLGVPLRLLRDRDANQSRGRRWQSADGKITLDTRSNGPGEVELDVLYQRLVAVPTPGRVVTYKVIRPDYFVIAGETPAGKFYIRYASSKDGVRGFSVGYDRSLSPTFDRVVVAIANSFTPFPSETTSAGASTVQRGISGHSAMAVLVGTGLVIGTHRVATAAALETCQNMRVSGLKPIEVRQTEHGITFVDVAEALKPAPIRVRTLPDRESLVLVVAFAEDRGQHELVVAPGSLEADAGILAALQPGAAGAPVFDESGALLGFAGPERGQRRTIAGVMPVARRPIIVAQPVAASERIHTVSELGTALGAAEVVTAHRSGIVPIECGS